jgi:tetratricopeptide (TPR) repeat protein
MPRFFARSSVRALALHTCLVLAALQLGACSSREERAQSYYEHGKSYLEKNDFVKARIELRNAIQQKDDMVEAWRALVKVDEHDKNWQGLAGDLRRITELDPKDAKARVQLARLFLIGGALKDALKMSNEATDIEPQNAATLALKAAVLFRLKDSDGAVQTAQKALEIEPGNVDANVVLAAEKLTKGDPIHALRTLNNVASDHKDDLGVLLLKVNIFDRMNNLEQVESVLRRIVALHPNEPIFRTQLVRFYVAHKRPADAEKELRAVVAANPADTKAELELVNLLGAVKGPAAARAELVARINAGGSIFPYQIALARLDFAQGKFADSTKLLETLVSKSTAPENIMTARTTLAEMYMSRNDIAAAEPLVTEILRADNRNTNGLRLRASIHMTRNQIDDAIADLRSALNDQPRSPELLASLGLAYERSGSIELADKAFLDATKASKYAPAFGLNYVNFLRRRGLAAQADTVLADLASRNPNNIAVLSALAQVKLSHQDWAGAHAIADAIKRLSDKGNISDQINAAAFSGQGKFNESLALLQGAYEANPGAVQPMAAIVNVYLQSHQIDKAEDFLKAALKANPNNAEALVLMGSIQLAKNDPNKAVETFQSAINRQPKDVMGYRALADLYARQQKIEEARRILQAGLEQQPKSFALRLALAGLLEVEGEYEPAIAEYESLLKDQPGSMIVANNLASLLADHRSDKASLDQANSLAVQLKNSQVPQFKDTLGWVNYRRGDYAAAIPLLEDAAAKLPNFALVRYHLGMSYLATGRSEKASEQLKKARELAHNDAELQVKIDAALKSQSVKVKR